MALKIQWWVKRYCWQKETGNCTDSLETWNSEEAWKWHKPKRGYNLTQIGSLTIYDIKKQKGQVWSFMASSESVKDIVKRQTLKQPKLAQLDKVLHKSFTAMHSKGKPMTKPMISEQN
jgi:hypothetical protein